MHAHYVRVGDKGQARCTYDCEPLSKRSCFSDVVLWAESISQGTAQFMAMTLLRQNSDVNDHVVHEAAHDIQCFIWVFSYCIMRNLLIRASKHPQQEVRDQRGEFRRLFSAAFAQTTFKNIVMARGSNSHALTFPKDKDIY